VWGKTAWANALRELIARKAKGNRASLPAWRATRLLRTPPLGFFKDFVVESDGRHTGAINIKRRGTAPLSDLIRVHALAIGSESLNSFERLQGHHRRRHPAAGRGQDLHDALEFISMVRARNQAESICRPAIEPDNSIEPEKLSDFERKSLRDAFLILSNAQKYPQIPLPARSGGLRTTAMLHLGSFQQLQKKTASSALSSAETPDWPARFRELAASARDGRLKAFYSAGAVSADTPLSAVPLTALDIETTGSRPGA
jgi:hypothetical protein